MESEGSTGIFSKWRRYNLIEIPVFLDLCASGMTETVFSDLILYQTCRITLNETLTDTCNLLHNNSSSQAARDLEQLIQPRASYILLSKSLIEGILPAIFSLFLGPWSDRYGRKPILIAAFTGPFIRFVMLSILSVWNLNPWIYLIASIPRALLGGVCGLMLSIFCYISDITNDGNRAWRLACVENSLAAGLVVGTFLGPFIFQRFGYTTLFIAATFTSGLTLFNILFLIPESVKRQEPEHKWKNPFDVSLVKKLFQTATRKRPGLDRSTLWSCILILSLYVIAISGEINTGFLFANARLGWNVVQYSEVSAICTVLAIAGVSLGMKIFRRIGFSELSVALVGTISIFSGSMITAFTFKPWHMYLAGGCGVFSALLTPPIRSILSKSVPPADVVVNSSLVGASSHGIHDPATSGHVISLEKNHQINFELNE
uniref:Slc46a1_3 protein n=1 Tax=Fopius arisanus TaxID=64838 RepID=A0A0C9QV57_9HYME